MQMDANGLLHSAQKFVYSNGQDQPPTAISLDKALMKELLFNQSPSKVCQALVYPENLVYYYKRNYSFFFLLSRNSATVKRTH
jgi:hypothetical protein